MARETRDISAEEQLRLWVEGRPVHRAPTRHDVVDEDGTVVRTRVDEGGECCPDFSCCNHNLLVPKEAREAYRDADEQERYAMLTGFLGRMLKSEGCEVEMRPLEEAPQWADEVG